MKQTSQTAIRRDVEATLKKMLKGQQVSDDQKTAVGYGIKYLGVIAKLDESEWGGDLDELNEGGDNESETDN